MRDFFRCAARLVVTIYDLLLASILGICGSDASIAYPIPFSQFNSHPLSTAATVMHHLLCFLQRNLCFRGLLQPGFSNRWEPVRADSGLGRYQTGPNLKFKFKF